MSVEFVEKKRWLFLGLPFTFTKYVIKEDMITVDTGVFTKVENDCYMYKVQDVEHTASIWERMVGLGTIVCYTGDTTHPKLLIEHIRNSKQIKEFILKESEEARLKRRTVKRTSCNKPPRDWWSQSTYSSCRLRLPDCGTA